MSAQSEESTGYEFLSIPSSAHSAALGGSAVSLAEDDASLLFINPALMCNVSDRTLMLNYTSYISGTMKLGAVFTKKAGERGTMAFGAQLLNYGEMTETNSSRQEIGTFTANDIAVQGGYTYLLGERWSGGVQAKALFSSYGSYSSVALGVDLGLNYYDAEGGWSASLVGQNLGGQIDPLYDVAQALPFHLAFGISKELADAPLRVHFSLPDITHWQKEFFYNMNIGVDIFPSSQTWLAVGYNPLRAAEMRTGTDDKSHGAGLSFGGGLSVKRFKLGLSYAKYHVASSSILVNASFSF